MVWRGLFQGWVLVSKRLDLGSSGSRRFTRIKGADKRGLV